MSTIPKGPHKTLSEWLRLVTEARQSGLTDCEWCRRNGISVHTFNNAIRRLMSIPDGFEPQILTTVPLFRF